MRSSLWIAGVALIALFSGAVSAVPINENINIDFGGGANLNIVFTGDTGANLLGEYAAPQTPPFSEITTFTATYTEAGPLNGLNWTGVGLVAPLPPPGVFGDLTTLLFDSTGPGLLSLFAQQALNPLAPPPFRLRVGSAVGNPANRAEIEDFFGQVVAAAPIPQNIPAPGTLALVGLGLVALRRIRR